MPNFSYAALDAKGEQTTGAVTANTEQEAIQQLRAQGLYPTQIMEEGKGKKGAKTVPPSKRNAQAKPKASKKNLGGSVKPKSLMIFTRQLATLIDSGLPLLRSLTVLENRSRIPCCAPPFPHSPRTSRAAPPSPSPSPSTRASSTSSM